MWFGDREGLPPADVSGALAAFERTLQRAVSVLDARYASGHDLDADGLAAVIDLCAWAHAEWIRIHPFANGNGRTARIWANALLMRYGLPPGLGYWKGADEPAWGRVPVDRVQRFHDIVQELDSEHPVWITQAPRGTLDSLVPYDPAYEIGAIDIYPVSYPPGLHSDRPNKNLSVVGEYADLIAAAGDRTKPFWMVLQICWSGVIGTGRTLRMPTFPEERYMTYVSIVHGARGLAYFGGNLVGCETDRDAALGWNWTFYDNVLKPVLTELNPNGPLFPALIAPDSDLPVTMVGADDVEFLVRDTSDYLYLLAAKREGATVRVTFNDLPDSIAGSGDVLFEEPRRVSVADGSFSDWFGPNEVHVYRFAHQP